LPSQAPATPRPGPERRRHYRAAVLTGSPLQARVWRLAPGVPLAQRPMPSQLIPVVVSQVSADGMTVTVRGRDGEPAKVSPADRLRVELQYAGRTVLVEGRLREPEARPADDSAFRAGILIQHRAFDRAHREAMIDLAAIVAGLQREELRARAQSRPPTSAAA
jgi:hypothetical protein